MDGAIGTLVLDHPEKRNALSRQLVDAVVETLSRFTRERVRVVVLRAPLGTKVWSSGHDVEELPEGGRDPLGWDDPLRYLVRAIEECPAPVIAMIEGGVWGGACEVAFACDLIIAAPNATFAVTPARLGVPYNVFGMLTFLNACSLRVAKEMAFTAKPISAERAERLGIINHLVPIEQLEMYAYGSRNRRECAAVCLGNEGTAAHARRCSSDEPSPLRARPRSEANCLRQCRLCGGNSSV